MQASENKKLILKRKKIRKILLTILFIALNVIVIAITAINEFGNSRNAAELAEVKINWWYLIPAVICFVVAFTLEIYKYALMIRKVPERKISQQDANKLARRTVILGRYYDNITPAAVGGQPFQVYYLHKNGEMTGGLATTISVFGMISIQIAFMIIAILCFIFSSVTRDNPALIVTAWFGLIFYAFWPVMVGMATFFPKATTNITKWCVKLLAKIRIVKNREAALIKVEHEVAEYVKSVKTILKKPKLFVVVIILSLIFNILIASIPYFVLTTFGGTVDFMSCFALTIAVMSAVYFVPTPGNSGAAEGTFYVVFSALSSGYVFWAMLFWRFFSYYIYIIMGLITYFIMHLEKHKKENKK